MCCLSNTAHQYIQPCLRGRAGHPVTGRCTVSLGKTLHPPCLKCHSHWFMAECLVDGRSGFRRTQKSCSFNFHLRGPPFCHFLSTWKWRYNSLKTIAWICVTFCGKGCYTLLLLKHKWQFTCPFSFCRKVISHNTVCGRTVCRLLWPNNWKQ